PIYDFFTGLHHKFVHIFNKRVDILLFNFVFERVARQNSAMLKALNMLTGNSDIDHGYFVPTHLFRLLYSNTNRLNRFFDVGHNSVHYSQRLRFTGAQNFNFPEFIFSTNMAGNFGGSDVEADYNFW